MAEAGEARVTPAERIFVPSSGHRDSNGNAISRPVKSRPNGVHKLIYAASSNGRPPRRALGARRPRAITRKSPFPCFTRRRPSHFVRRSLLQPGIGRHACNTVRPLVHEQCVREFYRFIRLLRTRFEPARSSRREFTPPRPFNEEKTTMPAQVAGKIHGRPASVVNFNYTARMMGTLMRRLLENRYVRKNL